MPDLKKDAEKIEQRPKSAFASFTPAPKKSSKMALSSQKSSVAKPEDFASFNAEKIVNTSYLAKPCPDKCIGCAVCMSP